MKYDCYKTLDYWHEYKRICHVYMNTTDAYECNDNCPLRHKGCEEPTAEIIAIVQKWSDEHPEIPKLTREEYDFLQVFRVTADKHIERKIGHLFLVMGYTTMELWPTMFSFIKEGETWFLGDLLKLEVEG